MNMVETWNYGNYKSDNYGSSRAVRIGNLTLYFSYKTVIAFCEGYSVTVSENVWSVTTGRHLNWIGAGDKKSRLPRAEFEEALRKTLDKYGLTL